MDTSCTRTVYAEEPLVDEEPQFNLSSCFPSCCKSTVKDCPGSDCPGSPTALRAKPIPVVHHPFSDVAIKAIPEPIMPRPSPEALEESRVPEPPLEEHPYMANTQAGQRLTSLREERPFVATPGHYLHGRYQECIRTIRKQSLKSAIVKLNRLELEADLEVRAMGVMFDLFKHPGVDALRLLELCRMLTYLGLPAEKADAYKVLDAFDERKEAKIDLLTFQIFVGNMGGSVGLFEKRKGALWAGITPRVATAPSLLGADETYEDLTNMGGELNTAGFEEHEMLYWRLALPLSESRAVAQLKPCQKAALRHIRMLARRNHQKALPKLERRMRELGCGRDDMWQVLSWIRECAPIIIQINLDAMMSPLNADTHYRNQFETSCSGGLLNKEKRLLWERNLFQGDYDTPDVDSFDRVKYGVLNVMYDHRGVARTEQYGDSYFILKDARLRCTFAPQDSANLSSDKLAVIDYFAHDLVEYTDAELKEVIKVATSEEPVVGDSCVVGFLKYKEAQIHGDVKFSDHVQRLVAHDRHKIGYSYVFLADICKKHGIELSWLSDERSRMEHERTQCLSPMGKRRFMPEGKSDPFKLRGTSKKSVAGPKPEMSKAGGVNSI